MNLHEGRQLMNLSVVPTFCILFTKLTRNPVMQRMQVKYYRLTALKIYILSTRTIERQKAVFVTFTSLAATVHQPPRYE